MVEVENKKQVIEKCIKGKVSEKIFNFVMLLIDKRRESELQNIYDSFLNENDMPLNRIRVNLTLPKDFSKNAGTPVAGEKLDEEIKKSITSFIVKNQKVFSSAKLNDKSEVHFQVTVDPDILGGFRVRIGDQYLDVSALNYLQKWRKQVLSEKIEVSKYWSE